MRIYSLLEAAFSGHLGNCRFQDDHVGFTFKHGEAVALSSSAIAFLFLGLAEGVL